MLMREFSMQKSNSKLRSISPAWRTIAPEPPDVDPEVSKISHRVRLGGTTLPKQPVGCLCLPTARLSPETALALVWRGASGVDASVLRAGVLLRAAPPH